MELLDQRISLWINSFYSQATDWFWILMSDKAVWFPMYAVVAVVLFRRLGWKRGLVAFLAIVLTIVAADQICNVFKHGVGRLRPCCNAWMLEHGLHTLEGAATWSSPFGFFSVHAANSLGFAVGSIRCFRWDTAHCYKFYSCFVLVWAVLVTLSRVFAGKHYFGDVLVGAAVGILLALFFTYIGELSWKRYTKSMSAAATE